MHMVDSNNSSKLWVILWKFNAVAIAIVAVLAIAMLVISMASSVILNSHYSDFESNAPVAAAENRDFNKPAVNEIEEVEGTPFLVVRIAQNKTTNLGQSSHAYGDSYDENVVQERNAMILNGETGSSRFIFSDNDQILRRWHILNDENTAKDQTGYLALVEKAAVGKSDSKSKDKKFDVLLGNFATAKQRVIVKGIDAIDSVRLVDNDKAAMIIWHGWKPTFLMVDMRTLKLIRSKEFPFPTSQAVSGS